MTAIDAVARQANHENLQRQLVDALEKCYADLQRFAPNSAGSIAARDVLTKAKEQK